MFPFSKSSGPKVQPIDPKDAIARASAGTLTIIDVREPSETASGYAQGAHLIPMSLLPLKLNPAAPDLPLTPKTPIALYCAAGGRSQASAEHLLKMGYTEVYNIGGLAHWINAGGPVTR